MDLASIVVSIDRQVKIFAVREHMSSTFDRDGRGISGFSSASFAWPW